MLLSIYVKRYICVSAYMSPEFITVASVTHGGRASYVWKLPNNFYIN